MGSTAASAFASGKRAKSFGVALFTPTSVVCALRTTEHEELERGPVVELAVRRRGAASPGAPASSAARPARAFAARRGAPSPSASARPSAARRCATVSSDRSAAGGCCRRRRRAAACMLVAAALEALDVGSRPGARAPRCARPRPSVMSFTPCALRPVSRISSTRVRSVCPRSVMSITSSPSFTSLMPTTGPLRSLASMRMMPLPPRFCVRNSSMCVRLP